MTARSAASCSTTGPPARTSWRWRSTRCARSAGSSSTSWWSVNGARAGGLPDGVRGVGAARGRRHPGRRATPASPAGARRAPLLPRRRREPRRRRRARARGGALRGRPAPRARSSSRVAPRGGGAYSRDWVPRLRVGDRTRPSDVAALWEGAVAVRRAVFDAVGGWPAEFRFVHEGVDLAWRVIDAGFRVALRGRHRGAAPAARAGRGRRPHAYSAYYGARNRVWLARRHLPLPLGALFVASFARAADAAHASTHARRCAGTVTGCGGRIRSAASCAPGRSGA